MDQLKDNITFDLSCKAIHKEEFSSLVFSLKSNKKIPSGVFLCFTCLGDFTTLETPTINYERVGSFFKVSAKEELSDEWNFTFEDLKYEFRNFTDAPLGVYVDLGNGNCIDVSSSFTSDYVQKAINDEIPNYEEVKNHLTTFPQVNNVKTSGLKCEFLSGFNTDNKNAKRVDEIFKNVLDKESMLSSSGVLVDLEIDKNVDGYILNITEEKVKITSQNESFEFYAFLTLSQLWNFGNKIINTLEIEDSPRYKWRGLALDVVRQFYSIEEIKEILEHLALFKINILHLIVTNDEAWRLECDSYPILHEVGAFRGADLRIKPQFASSSKKYGGYYTKAQLKELISFAKELNIEIMPEIDLPAHAHAILKCLPELVEKEDTSTYTSVQGYTDNTLNPAIPFTWVFIENIIKEYSQVFDFDYLHMGFDERPHGSWENSPLCRKFMEDNSLASVEDLQTYCAIRVKNLLSQYGKKSAFWEEAAADGNLEKDALLFSWQTEEVTLELANKGYEVIATPAQYCYFDIRQDNTFDSPGLHWVDVVTLDKTYSFKPAQHEKIIGIHGALFSENLIVKPRVYEMLFPRLIALSEVSWTNDNRKNLNQFKDNLNKYIKNKFKKEC